MYCIPRTDSSTLDERLALPSESYLISYFDNLDNYFEVGPPVYFIIRGGNVTARPDQQELCGKFTTCDDFSVANVLEVERNRPESSFITEPASMWVDDFFRWLNPQYERCCRVRRRDPGTFCGDRDRERLCQPCLEGQDPAWNITMNGLPEGAEFMRYLKQWLSSPTTDDCPFAGAASYKDSISLHSDGSGIEATDVRTYNAPLKTQDDFINALAASRRIADDLSARTGLQVFPYSLFHVFFDQYAHVVAIMQELLGLGLAAVLLVTSLFLGSWRTGIIVTAVVGLTVTSCMGIMGAWGISLNAISVVNLVISLGIAVEFCAHVARAFMNAGSGLPVDHPSGQKERDERMYTALVDVGPSVCIFFPLRLTMYLIVLSSHFRFFLVSLSRN
jgi:Niemann-Pick C1 protein